MATKVTSASLPDGVYSDGSRWWRALPGASARLSSFSTDSRLELHDALAALQPCSASVSRRTYPPWHTLPIPECSVGESVPESAVATVVLDTNVFRPHLNVDRADMIALRELAEARCLRLAIVDLTLHECSTLFLEHYARQRAAYLKSFKEFAPFLNRPHVMESPEATEALSSRLNGIKRTFDILRTPPEAAIEALVREATRLPPAKPKGTGARDCAIWLTIAGLANSGEEVYFVTQNSQDFGVNELSSELEADLAPDAKLHFFSSLLDLLQALTPPTPASEAATWAGEEFVVEYIRAFLREDVDKTLFFSSVHYRSPRGWDETPWRLEGPRNIRLLEQPSPTLRTFSTNDAECVILTGNWEATYDLERDLYLEEYYEGGYAGVGTIEIPLTLLIKRSFGDSPPSVEIKLVGAIRRSANGKFFPYDSHSTREWAISKGPIGT